MFYIIQVCCIDCDKFISFRICTILDYTKFIRNNYNNFRDYSYYIFGSDNLCVDIVQFL